MIEIKIPSPGESITQVQVAKWLVSDGEPVEKDQEIVEIDSDKASFPIASPEKGTVKILIKEGETAAVGDVVATIEISSDTGASDLKPKAPKDDGVIQPATQEVVADMERTDKIPGSKPESITQPGHQANFAGTDAKALQPVVARPVVHASPLARKIMEEKKIPATELGNAFGGKKIMRRDIEEFIRNKKVTAGEPLFNGARNEERKKLSMLRLKLAERLVAVKNQTAMLTTFNEINMQAAIRMKEQFSGSFREKYGVGLGFMSLFTKAVTIALQDFPQVNSMIDGDELVMPGYADIGIAVSAPKGLVVPVLRNAEMMSIPEIEIRIKELAVKARDNKITIDDMKGGTFTITNGGVFGSLMSTPILNPPQSAILGMHKIQDRPVAINGQVVIAPMMYIALSYDHRVIDGRESVGFLVKVKELVEDPVKMLTGGADPVRLLLDL
jgi:2-oxoglutarate dehydrogenase E2 component (dihydrolipoamide succinyltransferase)